MNIEIITQNDLKSIKTELIQAITYMLSNGQASQKPILTNDETKKLLGVSSGTLRNYRIKGLLTYSKVQGIIYYEYSDILELIKSNKVNSLSKKHNGKT